MNIFDEVKANIPMTDMLEHYGIKVTRGKFICPFHNDTHPSASIKNDYFNCFVCGAGGDVITFTARYFDTTNFEASKQLAAEFGIRIDTPQSTAEKLRAERERKRRLANLKAKKELEELIAYTGDVLARYHRYCLLHNKYDYLAQAQYYCECFDNAPEDYSQQARKQVREIDRRLSSWLEEE